MTNQLYFPAPHILYSEPYAQLTQTYPDAYFASWTAAEIWNIADELSRQTIMFSPTTEKEFEVDNFSVYIKKVPENFFFEIEDLELDDVVGHISSPTKTLIDCFAYPDLAGGTRQVEYIFGLYQESPLYNPALLIKHAKRILSEQQTTRLFQLIKGA